MKKISDFLDSNNLIVHRPPNVKADGGDSPQRTFTYWYALAVMIKNAMHLPECMDGPSSSPDLKRTLSAINYRPGEWIRNPLSNETWHSDPKEFSRDQQTPLVIALGEWRYINQDLWNHLSDTEKAHRERFLWKYQNKDYANFQHMSYYNRAFDRTRNYFIPDMILRSDVFFRCLSSDPGDVGDDLNLCLALIQARTIKPTSSVFSAIKSYVANRKHTYGSFFEEGMSDEETIARYNSWKRGVGLPLFSPIQGAWKWYFRQPWAPPMDEVMKPLLDLYFV